MLSQGQKIFLNTVAQDLINLSLILGKGSAQHFNEIEKKNAAAIRKAIRDAKTDRTENEAVYASEAQAFLSGNSDDFIGEKNYAIIAARKSVVSAVALAVGDTIIRRRSDSLGEKGLKPIFSLPPYREVKFTVQPNEDEKLVFQNVVQSIASSMVESRLDGNPLPTKVKRQLCGLTVILP